MGHTVELIVLVNMLTGRISPPSAWRCPDPRSRVECAVTRTVEAMGGLTERARGKILGTNAARLYGLHDAAARRTARSPA
jgi:hypothetical protein